MHHVPSRTLRTYALAAALSLAVIGASPTSANAATITADYTTVLAGAYPSLALGGTTVTGSASVVAGTIAGFSGLGIQGGGNDASLDVGETMTVDFGQLVQNVSLTIVDVAPVGNASLRFEPFAGASSLGMFLFPSATTAPQTFDLTLLAGGVAFSRFTLSVPASPPLGFQVQAVSYEPQASVPEPTGMLLLAAGLLAAGRQLRRRQ